MKLPDLFGKIVDLKPLTMEHVSRRYVDWLNDPEVNRFLETKYKLQTLDSVEDFVRSKIESTNEHLFGIFMCGSGTHIGNIKLGPINPHHLHGDISLFVGEKSAWGKGAATEAIRLITRWAFRSRGLQKLKAGCYSANEGSARAFEKNGFRREGLFKDHLVFQGQPMDMIVLGYSRRDFNADNP